MQHWGRRWYPILQFPTKIRESLNVESGLNDGICVPVLFLLIAVFATQSGEGLSSFYGLQILGKEIGIGLLAGCSLSFCGLQADSVFSKTLMVIQILGYHVYRRTLV